MSYTLLDVAINPISDILVTMANHWWIPALIILGVAVVIGLTVFFIKKNKNNRDKE